MQSTSTVKFGVYAHPLVQYIRSKSGVGGVAGGVYSEFVQNIPSIRPCITFVYRKHASSV